MALKLENEFLVDAPIERTWQTLLDLGRVAQCLPGASVEPDGDGSFVGSMRVKLGPVTMSYKGTARVAEIDQSARTATFDVQGKEVRGQGSASATIRNSLVEENGATRVVVETELSVTGRPAQFGRGIMQDVAGSMLADFASCLAEMMSSAAAASTAPHPAEPEPALDLTGAVGGALKKKLVAAAAALVAVVLLAKLLRRGKRRS